MHVGMSVIFQNPGEKIPDLQVYKQDLALARLAEPLGVTTRSGASNITSPTTRCVQMCFSF